MASLHIMEENTGVPEQETPCSVTQEDEGKGLRNQGCTWWGLFPSHRVLLNFSNREASGSQRQFRKISRVAEWRVDWNWERLPGEKLLEERDGQAPDLASSGRLRDKGQRRENVRPQWRKTWQNPETRCVYNMKEWQGWEMYVLE